VVWFRVDDNFGTHPKALAAGNAAVGLWTRCGTYAAGQLTDGHLPGEIAAMYGKPSEIKTLVTVRLWHQHGHTCERCPPVPRGSYFFHDFLEYNRSRVEVLAERAAASERQKRSRERRRDIARDDERDRQRESRGDHTVSHGPPDPTRPEGSSNPEDPPNPPAEPGGGCAKHGDKPAPNCRGCGTNSRAVQAAAGAAARQPPAWCGACDETTRQVETDDGRPARCPRCHPLVVRKEATTP
jgi:hypothetical protein